MEAVGVSAVPFCGLSFSSISSTMAPLLREVDLLLAWRDWLFFVGLLRGVTSTPSLVCRPLPLAAAAAGVPECSFSLSSLSSWATRLLAVWLDLREAALLGTADMGALSS
jgi:hypothetical protein